MAWVGLRILLKGGSEGYDGDGGRRRCWCCVSPAIMLLSDERFCTASFFSFYYLPGKIMQVQLKGIMKADYYFELKYLFLRRLGRVEPK